MRALLAVISVDRGQLVHRFVEYGESHGAWDDAAGYTEGSLARIIEAAVGETPVLESVKASPGFLCGTEFKCLADEVEFFAQRGICLDLVGAEVCIRPGELLLFDNLVLAHGRRGTRLPGELHQRLFGYVSLTVGKQLALRDCVLDVLLG